MNVIKKIQKEKGYSGIPVNKVWESEQCDSAMLNVKKFNTNASNKSLNILRQEDENRLVISQININPISNKFDLLSSNVCNNLDILLISETKMKVSLDGSTF